MDKLSFEAQDAEKRLKDLNLRIGETKKELDDLTLKKGVAEYEVNRRAGELRKLETQLDDSAGRIASLEETMQKNGISIKLFKEPSSLKTNEVRFIVAQLETWSDEAPTKDYLRREAVRSGLHLLAKDLGGL